MCNILSLNCFEQNWFKGGRVFSINIKSLNTFKLCSLVIKLYIQIYPPYQLLQRTLHTSSFALSLAHVCFRLKFDSTASTCRLPHCVVLCLKLQPGSACRDLILYKHFLFLGRSDFSALADSRGIYTSHHLIII